MISKLPMSGFRKLFFLLLFAELFSFSATANPGDTTWVTVWNLRKLTHYGTYDTTAVFPTNKRYRKIRLHYILGRYACPPGSQYCGSWDYTTQIHALPAGKDSVEIARVITPYATNWLSLNKTHDYVVEVTDYASVLEGSTGMRFDYEGYSWGFTITLKIEFIEGVPPMDALSVKNVYDGYYQYGNTSNPIENYLTAKTYSYASPASRVLLKNTVSGHGSDNAGCAEFCSRYYQLKLNNTTISQKQLWRNDCGWNEVYPQTGTWIYERGNWCPGAVVWPIYHDLSALTTANTNFTVDVDMQPYVGGGSLGGYNFVSHLINYSAPNHSLDVSIEDIIAPTKDDNYFRENPRCSNPIIKIRNVGTASLSSVNFNYGLHGDTVLNYTWTGNLGYLDTALVVLPPSVSILSHTSSAVFEVSVTAVNGTTGDQNSFNNIYSSKTIPVDIFPDKFVIRMLTNNSTDPISLTNETSWILYDDSGNIIMQRDQLANATVYIDTLFLWPGCFKFEIRDTGCDGMSWWANAPAGNGSLRFDYYGINNTIFLYPGDIGCGYTKYFTILDPNIIYVGTKNSGVIANSIEVYPNPAANMAYIRLNLNKSQAVSYRLLDITGKLIQQKKLENVITSYETIDTHELSNGVYFITVELGDKSLTTKKLVIQK